MDSKLVVQLASAVIKPLDWDWCTLWGFPVLQPAYSRSQDHLASSSYNKSVFRRTLTNIHSILCVQIEYFLKSAGCTQGCHEPPDCPWLASAQPSSGRCLCQHLSLEAEPRTLPTQAWSMVSSHNVAWLTMPAVTNDSGCSSLSKWGFDENTS